MWLTMRTQTEPTAPKLDYAETLYCLHHGYQPTAYRRYSQMCHWSVLGQYATEYFDKPDEAESACKDAAYKWLEMGAAWIPVVRRLKLTRAGRCVWVNQKYVVICRKGGSGSRVIRYFETAVEGERYAMRLKAGADVYLLRFSGKQWHEVPQRFVTAARAKVNKG